MYIYISCCDTWSSSNEKCFRLKYLNIGPGWCLRLVRLKNAEKVEPCWGKEITGDRLGAFTTSPHFQFTVSASCLWLTIGFLNSLLWFPDAMLSIIVNSSSGTINQVNLILPINVLDFYYSNRKVTKFIV